MGRLKFSMSQDAFEQNKRELKSTTGFETPFLKAEEGVNFRVLPNTFVGANESWFQMIFTHSNLTANGNFVIAKCSKTDDPEAKCPICAHVAKTYSMGELDTATKDVISKISKKANWYIPVYVRNGQFAGQVRWWKLNKDNIDKVTELGKSKRTANFHDIYDGADLEMKVIKKKFGNKEISMINFQVAGDDSPLASNDDEMERIINSIEPLTNHITSYPYDQLKEMLHNYLANVPDEENISDAPDGTVAEHDTSKLDNLIDSIG